MAGLSRRSRVGRGESARAADAADGGEGVMPATATLNRPLTLDGRGDAAGRMVAVEEARGSLGGR